MSITGELREYARIHQPYKSELYNAQCADEITAIADRIDAEHESACAEAYGNGVMSVPIALDESAWVELPKDADGEVWHIGDRTESGQTIEAMGLNKHGWHFVGTVNEIDPAIHRHHHAPTVEDVLTEFGIDWEHESDCEDRAALLKEYAAKLRLVEEEDA